MAQYFFHLHDGIDVLLDPDGRSLDSHDAVVAATLGDARAIIAHDALGGRILLDQSIEVWDASGTIVHRLAFEDAVEIVRSAPPG